MKNNLNKGFVAQGLLLGVLFIIVAGASYYVGTRKVESPTIIENNFKPVTQDSLDNVKPISNTDKSAEKVVVEDKKINTKVDLDAEVSSSEGVDDFGSQGKCGFVISSPVANIITKFPLTISGSVDNSNYEELGCKWIISEEKAATAQLYYNYNNHGWTPADIAIPIKFNGYTNGKATFSTKMDFKNDNDIVISVGTPMKIVFKDMGEIDGQVANKFDLPINYR